MLMFIDTFCLDSDCLWVGTQLGNATLFIVTVTVYGTEIQNSRSERQSPRFVSGVCTLPSLHFFALCLFSSLEFELADDFFFF